MQENVDLGFRFSDKLIYAAFFFFYAYINTIAMNILLKIKIN